MSPEFQIRVTITDNSNNHMFIWFLGEPPDHERSTSSVKSDAVSVHADAEEFPASIIHVTPTHNSWGSGNSAPSEDSLPATRALSGVDVDENDVVV